MKIRPLAQVEMAGSISQTRADMALATTWHGLSSQHAQALAAQRRMRGADAVYAAVALQTGGTLISRDNEHHTRLIGLVTVLTPEAVLATLPPLAAPAAPEGAPDP
jgi:hypothetical protein